MSFVNSGLSAVGRLGALVLLVSAFVFGLAGVVYMSLRGAQVTVPDITGKVLPEGEKELAMLGLKIKKRAERSSHEAPNTVIEQLPKPGETVKTGQMILVVTSKGTGDGDAPPSSLKSTNEDDTEKIEEMISDKPKKPKANSNTNRKKVDTARDVNANNSDSNSNSNSNSSDSNSNKKDAGSNKNSNEETNRNSQTPPGDRQPNTLTIKQPKTEVRPKPPTRP